MSQLQLRKLPRLKSQKYHFKMESIHVNPLGISPSIFSIDTPFHLELRWYGVMYLLSYIIGYHILKYLIKKGFIKLDQQQLDSFIFHIAVGMVVGARVMYSLVYDFDQWIQDPISIIFINRGGLSFHGAVIGMTIGTFLFCKKNKINFLRMTDAMGLAGAQGLFFGRIGNFINGELYGRITDVPWGMIFSQGGQLPRHPSMLYEGFFEGIILTFILWFFLKRVKFEGTLSSIFLGGYAISRFIIEFVREPDQQLGFFADYFTMGQILCSIMFIIAIVFFIKSKKYAIPTIPELKIQNKKNKR